MDGSPNKEQERGVFLHPASGALILVVDWLLFSGVLFGGGVMVVAAMFIGFVAGLVGVSAIQQRWGRESRGRALAKGVLAGVVVGLPFPVGGTLLGGAVLAASGLDQLRNRAARQVAQRALRGRHRGEGE